MTAPIAPIPVQRELVPPPGDGVPDGFAVVEEALRGGVPHRFVLAPRVNVVVVVPTGVAAAWRDADPTLVVSSTARERAPHGTQAAASAPTLSRPPARLLVEAGGTLAATLPLVARLRRVVLAPEAAVAVEIAVMDWELRAGTVRGGGDYGSHVTLAWRDASAGADAFSPPPTVPDPVDDLPAPELPENW